MRILVVSEYHILLTGYSTYYKNICEALHNAGHEVNELASYGNENLSEHVWAAKKCPWNVYLNIPNMNHQERWNRYNQARANLFDADFGSWDFENIVLDCMPDVVIAIRDHWYDKFILESPLAKYYKVILSPTVDSAPQKADWLDTFQKVDALTFYTQWSEDWLKTQYNQPNIVPHIPPGPNPEYKPVQKDLARKQLGLPTDSKILLTVMRNQGRKMYPYLFEAFSQLKDKSTLLYCHTHFEDRGWDLPKLIAQNGITNRVYFSYKCKNCFDITSDLLKANNKCQKCNSPKEICSVQDGADNESLNYVYNAADLYIQWANCLKPDQEVLIKRDGYEFWCPISRVEIGDFSWTHKNRWCKVLNVWKNLIKSMDKKVLDLHMCGDFEVLSCTENHEFPAITKNEFKKSPKRSVRETIGNLIINDKSIPNHTKYELKDLSKGDMLLYPIDTEVQDINNMLTLNCNDNIPKSIIIDNDFCRFIGLFAADGSWQIRPSTKNIQVTCNINELDNITLVKNTFTKIAPNHKITEYKYKGLRNAINLMVSSDSYAVLFSQWFLKHENKKLPDWVMKLPVKKQIEIIIGMFMGDGHYCKSRKCSIYTTISLELARQLKHLLRRCKIQFACKKVNRKKHKNSDNKKRKNCYRFEIYGSNIKAGIINSKINGSNGFYYQDYHVMKINKIVDNDYDGDVWCLEVEDDHTMTTRTCATYQSEGFGIPIIEAAATGLKVITVDFSAPEDIATKIISHPIKPLSLQREMGTLCSRAVPDNKALIELLDNPDSWIYDRDEVTKKLRENYDWAKTGEKWVALTEQQIPKNNWMESPILKHPPSFDQIKHLNTFDFVKNCVLNVAQDESLLGTFLHCEALEHLDTGFFIPEDKKTSIKGQVQKSVTKEMVYYKFYNILENRIRWERKKNEILAASIK